MDTFWHPLWTYSLLLQFLINSMEVSLLAFPIAELDKLCEQGHKGAARIQNFRSTFSRLYAMLRSGYLVALGAGFVGVAFIRFHDWTPELSMLLGFLVFSLLSMGPGYLIPRALAVRYPRNLALFLVYPAVLLHKILWLIYTPAHLASNLFLKGLGLKASFELIRPDDELEQMLAEGVKAGTIQHSEREFIANILEFSETVAREIMVPRVEVQALEVAADRSEIDRVFNLNFSRVPVFQETMDNIVGILNVKDLMRSMVKNQEVKIRSLVRPPYYVPVSMKIGNILSDMQKNKIRMAVVVDEYGGTAGMLTMEDILEEIVGEIQEATALTEEEDIRMLADNTFLVKGACSLGDFNEYFSVEMPESESYTSVAGFIIEKMGRFPEVGEKFTTADFSFELIRKVRQRLEQFRVVRLAGAAILEGAAADVSGE